MKIIYYEVDPYGRIQEGSIDTESLKYRTHNDDFVTFEDSYLDYLMETQYHTVTCPRHFKIARDERIAAYKRDIEEYQKTLENLESVESYEDYTKVKYK